MTIHSLYILVCLLFAFVFSSCDSGDDGCRVDNTSTVAFKIEFDWSEAEGADPEGMCVFFYPLDGDEGSYRRFDFRGMTGGEAQLSTGHYRVICYNNDTDGVLFSGTDGFFSHTAYTRDGNVLEPIYGNGASGVNPTGEHVVICPDMMWGCYVADVSITADGVSIEGEETSERTLTLHPKPLVCEYSYEILNVKGLEHVSSMCASLSGMAGELNLSTGNLGSESVTLPFGAHSDGGSTISGKFYTFGHNELNLTSHRLNLYVIMDDGTKYVYGTTGQRFNVTNQIHISADRLHVHFTIDGLDLPEPLSDGGGMNPSFDDWNEVNTDIDI